MEDIHDNDHEQRRPLGMTLLGGLYLFFFLLTVSSFGHPFPFLGTIQVGRAAGLLVFVDSLFCLYLFLGVMQRQRLTWYLLLGYNLFELLNTALNLAYISSSELEAAVGEKIDPQGVMAGNLAVMAAIILLSGFIFRLRSSFTNRSTYLFFN